MTTHDNDNTAPLRLLKLREVMALTSLGSSTIYRRLAEGTFPAPRELSTACVRWVESEVKGWIATLPIAARAGRAA